MLAALISLGIFTVLRAAENMAPNPGFEIDNSKNAAEQYSGSIISTKLPHSGAKCIKQNYKVGNSWNCMQSNPPYIKCKLNTWYRLSTWNRNTMAAGDIAFGIRYIGAENRSIDYGWKSIPNNASKWTKYSYDFLPPKGTVEMAIYFKVGRDVISGDTWWDDIFLEEIPTPIKYLEVSPLKSTVFYRDVQGKFSPNFLYNQDKRTWQDVVPENERLIVSFADVKLFKPILTFTIQQRYKNKILKELKFNIPAKRQLTINPELEKLPWGDYIISLALVDAVNGNNKVLAEYTRNISIMRPFEFPELKPIKKVTINNNSILVNGEPFVPIMFSHDCDSFHGTIDFQSKLTALGDNVHSLFSNYNAEKTSNDEILQANIKRMQGLLEICSKSNNYARVSLAMPSWGFELKTGKFNLENLRIVVNALKNHPALFMWDLIDEPEIRKIPAAEVKRAYDLIKSLDPNHPIRTNLCIEEFFNEYSATSDIASYDRYPYPSTLLSEIYSLNQKILSSSVNKRPLLCYLQTYNKPGIPLPSPEWLKAEIYLCITQGMNMFAYYSFLDPKPFQSMSSSQELQSQIKKCNIELYQLTDMLNAPSVNLTEISSLKKNSIHYVYKQVKGEKYFVTVNITDTIKKCKFSLPEGVDKQNVEVLFEDGRTITPNRGILKETFLPYEVHIYKY